VGRGPPTCAIRPTTATDVVGLACHTGAPTTAPESSQNYRLVGRLRDQVIAPIDRASGANVYVGGWTATQVDASRVVSNRLAVFIAVVIGLSALLLLLMFRSVVILFAIVFGLAMDYEMFLISRIHEAWQRTGDHTAAIEEGLSRSGRAITAAATVMIVVLAAFALSSTQLLKLIGLSLAGAVLLDALVIRTLLLPATLHSSARAPGGRRAGSRGGSRRSPSNRDPRRRPWCSNPRPRTTFDDRCPCGVLIRT
jgi:RND superfamily putative drug exporter